jgi:ADP-dependent NAD(P)H-hydrate dehydratase / NAD(P)H-hydrate epimerase
MKKITAKLVRELLPLRPLDAHKGTFGKVLVIGGSKNFPGAPVLSSLGALRVGAGYLTIALPESIYPIVASKVIEPTFIPLPEDQNGILIAAVDILESSLDMFDVILIGNGLGMGSSTQKFVQKFLSLKIKQPIVIDADGLNIISSGTFLKDIKLNGVLTPHPGEMARLTGLSVKEIQADRIQVSKEFSKIWGVTIILKGVDTVIASPDGEVYLNPFSIPSLATAGTGDVLAGMIAGFLGQGLNVLDASIVGTYIHGLTGEKLQNEIGDAGVIASDLLDLLPHMITQLKHSK